MGKVYQLANTPRYAIKAAVLSKIVNRTRSYCKKKKKTRKMNIL